MILLSRAQQKRTSCSFSGSQPFRLLLKHFGYFPCLSFFFLHDVSVKQSLFFPGKNQKETNQLNYPMLAPKKHRLFSPLVSLFNTKKKGLKSRNSCSAGR